MFTKTSAVRKVFGLLLSMGVVGAVVTANSAPASAAINAQDRGFVSESVYCNSNTHTIEINFSAAGEQGGITGSDLFPRFETKPVWVIIWFWSNGAWTHTRWLQLPEGASTSRVTLSGTTYWYFQYAFANAAGGYDQAAEWADGNGQWGWYSDQYGYHTQPACYS